MKALEKQRAVALRAQGWSYREIRELLPVSQGSLSRWLREIDLKPEHIERIHQKNLQIRERFVFANHRRQAERRAFKQVLS